MGLADSVTSPVQHMCINHGRADVFVSHEFLDSTNIAAGLKQIRGKGMPEGMTSGVFDHSGLTDSLLQRPLKNDILLAY